MFSQVKSLVGGVNHDGIFFQTILFQIIEHFAYPIIHRLNTPQIIFYITVILPFFKSITLRNIFKKSLITGTIGISPRCQLFFAHSCSYLFTERSIFSTERIFFKFHVLSPFHIPSYFHLLMFDCSASTGIIVEEILRHVKIAILVQVEILCLGLPATVRGFLMIKQAERFRLVARVIEPVEGKLSCQRGYITRISFFDPIFDKLWIVILPLTRKNIGIIKSLRITRDMNFSNHGRLITILLQYPDKVLLIPIELRVLIIHFTIQMVKFAGKHYCTAWCRNRIRYKGFVKQHSLFRYTINIRSLVQMVTISADGLISMVVAHDKNDVGLLLRKQGSRGNKSRSHYVKGVFCCFHGVIFSRQSTDNSRQS